MRREIVLKRTECNLCLPLDVLPTPIALSAVGSISELLIVEQGYTTAMFAKQEELISSW